MNKRVATFFNNLSREMPLQVFNLIQQKSPTSISGGISAEYAFKSVGFNHWLNGEG